MLLLLFYLDYYFHFLLICFMHCLKHLLTLGPGRGFAGCMETQKIGGSVVVGTGVRNTQKIGDICCSRGSNNIGMLCKLMDTF